MIRRQKKPPLPRMKNAESWKIIFAAAYRRVPVKRLVLASGLAVLVHLFVYFSAPPSLAILNEFSPRAKVELVKEEDLQVPEELLPEEFKNKQKPQFVPVTPNASSEKPDKTDFHSADNQRAAQEKRSDGLNTRIPQNDGELEDSLSLSSNVIPRELLPKKQNKANNQKKEHREGTLEEQENADHGIKTQESENGEIERGNETEADETEEEIPDPQERPEIKLPTGLNTVTLRSNTAVNEIGVVSLDAKYSEFGDYQQRMLEAIQAAWYVRVETASFPLSRGVVRVAFTLCSDGTVKEAKVLSSSASEAATYACLDAVESRAPFEIWREEMVALLGNEQYSVITFHYRQ